MRVNVSAYESAPKATKRIELLEAALEGDDLTFEFLREKIGDRWYVVGISKEGDFTSYDDMTSYLSTRVVEYNKANR